MKIAFIGHAYHSATNLVEFFLQLLQPLGSVDWLHPERLAGGLAINNDQTISGYDLVVVWQTEDVVPILLEQGHKDFVFVPSDRRYGGIPKHFWKMLGDTRILCFSARLYEQLQKLGGHCVYARYCPNLDFFMLPGARKEALSGICWYRKDLLSIEGLQKLVRNLGLESLTVQYSPDPHETTLVDKEAVAGSLRIPVKFVDLRENEAESRAILAKSQFYITPGVFEEVGFSVFEAMAIEMVVVAPDNSTINECIIHGYNGILYEPSNYEWHPCEFDLEDMAKKARLSLERGRAFWLGFHNYLVEWLSGRTSERSYFFDKVSHGTASNGFAGAAAAPNDILHRNSDAELVTIATVVRNAVDDIELTMASIISQSYPNIEYVIVDGGSTDGTLDVIGRHSRDIDRFVSEPDLGTYDAMNKAASLATGKWILFLNAGDRFVDENSLADFLFDIPEDADFVVGHHVYRTAKGVYELHQVNNFDVTYRRLVAGTMDRWWLKGIPCHQASAIRTSLLAKNKYDLKYNLAADHEFMYRCKRVGAKFHLSNSFVSVYMSGGASWKNAVSCISEWREIAMKYSNDRTRVNRFYDSVLERHHLATLENMPLMEAIRYMIRYPKAAKSVFTSVEYLKALPRHVINRLLMSLHKPRVVRVGETSK